jgi:methylenetetrahydrofolate reductase (NADPH)
MTVCELLSRRQKPLLSFEFFPPKDEKGLEALKRVAGQVLAARPDFVTVTYGAGGSTPESTLQVCELLRKLGFDTVVPHLTCVGSSRAELEHTADDYHARGFRNVMALRGDPPKGETVFQTPKDGLAHASELVILLKARHADFCCGVGGYPEKHPEAAALDEDVAHLKTKLAAGAEYVTTQLFFDNVFYFNFVQRCREAGITSPIIPGLMPVLSYQQALRMTSLCAASMPDELARKLKAAGDGDVAEGIGIYWSVKQIEELLACNVPGIHLYVLNRAKAALAPGLMACLRVWRGP